MIWGLLSLLSLIRWCDGAVLFDEAEDAVLETIGIGNRFLRLLGSVILLLIIRVRFLVWVLRPLAHGLDLVIGCILNKVPQLQLLVALLVDDCPTG